MQFDVDVKELAEIERKLKLKLKLLPERIGNTARRGEPANPDREAWAHALAWKQWSLDEIASGDALVGIVEALRG